MNNNTFANAYHTIIFLSYLFSITSCQPGIGLPDASLCSAGCQLLYNENLNCISHLAFVANGNIIDIEAIVSDESYICVNPSTIIINQHQNADEDISNSNTATADSMFDFDSYVLIWQAIIIAIVVPITALLLYKLSIIILHKALETMQCKENAEHKCACCLYCCSVEYRQRRRNRKFHNEIYNNNNNKPREWKWRFGRKNNDNKDNNEEANDNDNAPVGVGENGIDIILENNDYQHVPLNDMDKNDGPPQHGPVLEEVSVEHNEMDKYLQAPGGKNQLDIELSFSSHGLRQISYREVV